MNNLNIAIVDSGVYEYFKHDAQIIEKYNIYYDDFGKIQIDDNVGDENGHGSCLYNLMKLSLSNVSFIIIKILNKDKRSSLEQLEFALEYLLTKKVDIILLCLAFQVCRKKH